jgi:heme oxygenase
MQRLKEGTADLHAQAEGHPFQTSLVRGQASAPDYHRWLAQMLGVHETLEHALVALRASHPDWAPILRDDLFQADRLRADLQHHGAEAALRATLPAAAAFRAWIERMRVDNPVALLGVLYVLEGSKNGNRFIARALRRRAGVEEEAQSPGYAYLDPHGETQRPLWLEFRHAMDALTFTPAEADAILAAARETFAAVTRISEDLVRANGVEGPR